jgi:hypothetical protein
MRPWRERFRWWKVMRLRSQPAGIVDEASSLAGKMGATKRNQRTNRSLRGLQPILNRIPPLQANNAPNSATITSSAQTRHVECHIAGAPRPPTDLRDSSAAVCFRAKYNGRQTCFWSRYARFSTLLPFVAGETARTELHKIQTSWRTRESSRHPPPSRAARLRAAKHEPESITHGT